MGNAPNALTPKVAHAGGRAFRAALSFCLPFLLLWVVLLPSLPAMQTAPPKRRDGKAPDGVREAAPRSAAQHERGRGSSTSHKEEKAGPYCTPLLYCPSIQFNFSWFSCISKLEKGGTAHHPKEERRRQHHSMGPALGLSAAG